MQVSARAKKYGLGILIILCLYGLWEAYCYYFGPGVIFTLGVSSDGQYVFSIDEKHNAVLWNLKDHTHKTIDKRANVYSAYFIKNSDDFMWQNLHTGDVIVQNVDGKEANRFQLKFPVYGQAMSSDLNYYVASDIDWNIYLRKNNQLSFLQKGYDGANFLGAQKLINFTFLGNDKLLTSGLASGAAEDPKYITGVFLWNLTTGKYLHDYMGNISLTFATISPDGQYVVGGDVGTWGYIWDTKTGKLFSQIWDFWYGIPTKQDKSGENIAFDKSSLIDVPADFADEDNIKNSWILSLKFIDHDHFLRFTTGIPYAVLYPITNPKPQKYFPLGRHPWPAVNQYYRDQAIDTSWQAHILVMGKEYKGGILVYQYDPEKQTLTKVWDGD